MAAAAATVRADPEQVYLAALGRAVAANVEIVEDGVTADGVRYFVVPSASRPGLLHTVRVVRGQVVCDCEARRLCLHAALCISQLESEVDAAGDNPWLWSLTPRGRAHSIALDCERLAEERESRRWYCRDCETAPAPGFDG